jgi:hypothetical protein
MSIILILLILISMAKSMDEKAKLHSIIENNINIIDNRADRSIAKIALFNFSGKTKISKFN